MTSIQELINLQTTTGGTIQRVIRNYKKDPAYRKSKAPYYHEKHRILSDLRDAFDQTNIEYFESQYYEQIQALVIDYLDIFNKEAEVLEPIHPSIAIKTNTSAMNKPGHGLIGKFNARSTTLKRMKLPSTNLLVTLLAMLLILPMVFGTRATNQELGSKLGINFEEIGSTTISTSQWNIIVYYDLSSYWSDS
ncbi:hypothetical protein GQX74_009949 [Glossina fuscipes]|nr:hypothetical protein GQX74_009949 [Glossina fuscipes]